MPGPVHGGLEARCCLAEASGGKTEEKELTDIFKKTNKIKDRWIKGWMSSWMDGPIEGWLKGPTVGRMDGQTNNWLDGWMDGWNSGQLVDG